MKQTTQQRLRESLSARNMLPIELSRLSGIGKSAISQYLSGKVTPKQDKIYKLAQALKVNESWLMGYDEPMEHPPAPASDDLPDLPNIFPIQTKKVPLLGTIATGVPIYADENFDGYRECTEDVDADFCLKIQGDSMIGANIQDGCLILVNPNTEVRSGDIAYVRWNDRCSVKGIIFYNDGRVELRPANKDFSSIWIQRDEVEFLTILGKVVRWLNMGVPNRIF